MSWRGDGPYRGFICKCTKLAPPKRSRLLNAAIIAFSLAGGVGMFAFLSAVTVEEVHKEMASTQHTRREEVKPDHVLPFCERYHKAYGIWCDPYEVPTFAHYTCIEDSP